MDEVVRYRLALMIGGLLFMVLVVGFLASAQELHVGEGQEYPTLSAAHANASAGDVLVLHGTIIDTLNVTKGVTIMGADEDAIWRISRLPSYIISPEVTIRDLNIGHQAIFSNPLILQGGNTTITNVTFGLAFGLVIDSDANIIADSELVVSVNAIEVTGNATGNLFKGLYIHDTPIAFNGLEGPSGNIIRDTILVRTNLVLVGDNEFDNVTLDGRPILAFGPGDGDPPSGAILGGLIIADTTVTLTNLTIRGGGLVISDSDVTIAGLRSDNASFAIYMDGGNLSGQDIYITAEKTNGMHFESADAVDLTRIRIWNLDGNLLMVMPGVGPVTITNVKGIIARGGSFLLQAPNYSLSDVVIDSSSDTLLLLAPGGIVADIRLTNVILQGDPATFDHAGMILAGQTYLQLKDLSGETIQGGEWDHVWIRNITDSTIEGLEIGQEGTIEVRDVHRTSFTDLRMVNGRGALSIGDSSDLSFTGCFLSQNDNGFVIDDSTQVTFNDCWIFNNANGSTTEAVVNATRTWWGGPDGPRTSANQSGIGEILSGPVDYHPFYREASQTTLIGYDGKPIETEPPDGNGELPDVEDDPGWRLSWLPVWVPIVLLGGAFLALAVARRR